MGNTRSTRIITILGILLVVGVLVSVFMNYREQSNIEPSEETVPEAVEVAVALTPQVIGTSVEGRNIEAYTYGHGENNLLFVGGIHGGYEWNSVLLAYRFIDYVRENPTIIPANVTVTVIPSANPDGLYAVIKKEGRFTLADVPTTTSAVGTGRFNAHNVDLNRNFDCKWQTESMWRGNVVSAGIKAFSEPEALALRDFIQARTFRGVVFWHSQANAVFASECEAGILPETRILMDTYANAAGYPAVSTFDAYEVTGDAEGWLASINVPAITVELKTHETIEWEKNLVGFMALLQHYK